MPQGSFKAGGKTINVADYGSKLGPGELKELAEKTGYTSESLLQKFKDAGGKIAGSVSSPTASTASTNTSSDYKGGGTTNTTQDDQTKAPTNLFENLYRFQAGLETIKNQGTLNATTVRADADKEIARIDAEARRYLGELGLQGTKYGADKEAEWRQAVANIEVKGKLDLQPIINAGLQRVAEIEGQSARAVAETTGSYALRSMQERTTADKELGKIQMAGGMYGLINSIFG
jgi:hypothetical protein